MASATLENATAPTPMLTMEMEYLAHEAGIKLEFVNGLSIWEASPVKSHQKKIDQIRASLKPLYQDGGSCSCISYNDLTIQFPDGSITRPDISIFTQEPEEEDAFSTRIPDIVIAVLNPGFEKKDTEITIPFYLRNGIPDIVHFDPATNKVLHYRTGVATEYDSPVELTFACGCKATI